MLRSLIEARVVNKAHDDLFGWCQKGHRRVGDPSSHKDGVSYRPARLLVDGSADHRGPLCVQAVSSQMLFRSLGCLCLDGDGWDNAASRP